jgi:hypothetical protein
MPCPSHYSRYRLSLPWALWIQFTSSHPASLISF